MHNPIAEGTRILTNSGQDKAQNFNSSRPLYTACPPNSSRKNTSAYASFPACLPCNILIENIAPTVAYAIIPTTKKMVFQILSSIKEMPVIAKFDIKNTNRAIKFFILITEISLIVHNMGNFESENSALSSQGIKQSFGFVLVSFKSRI